MQHPTTGRVGVTQVTAYTFRMLNGRVLETRTT
jgi:hypothetical protein